MHFLVCRRSEYVRESELATSSARYQQQFCGDRYSGAFLRSNIHRFWLLSLQTKVSAKKKKGVFLLNFSSRKEYVPVTELLLHLCFSLLSYKDVERHCSCLGGLVVEVLRDSQVIVYCELCCETILFRSC